MVNVCSGKPYSFSEIIKILETVSKKKIKIKKMKRTRKKVNHIMNNNLLQKIIGNYKFAHLDKNLDRLYNRYKSNEK